MRNSRAKKSMIIERLRKMKIDDLGRRKRGVETLNARRAAKKAGCGVGNSWTVWSSDGEKQGGGETRDSDKDLGRLKRT